MKTNKQRIEEKLNKEGFIIGCYDSNIDKLNYNNVKKILDNLCFGSTDIQVSLNRKKYIVEVSDVDNEYDFKMTEKNIYLDKYDDDEYYTKW
nr:MAG TPA: hypothetical protein [Caudoviricetes sp.]